MEREEYKFTLKDVLELLNPTGDSEDMVVISEAGKKKPIQTGLPLSSCLLTPTETLSRKVSSIYADVYDGEPVVNIWLVSDTE